MEASKLLVQWQGPYRVVRKVGRVDYQIEMPHRRKKYQIYHVNLLKKWEPPSAVSFLASDMDEDEEFPDWRERENRSSQPTFGSQLTKTPKWELVKLLGEFEDVLQGKPGHQHGDKTNPTASIPNSLCVQRTGTEGIAGDGREWYH